MRHFVIGLTAALLFAGPAFAGETCDQALKDTTAQSKGIFFNAGPKATATVAELIDKATEFCKGDAKSQAQGIETLRVARAIMGE